MVVLFNLAISSVVNWPLDSVGLQCIVGEPYYRTSGTDTTAYCQILSERDEPRKEHLITLMKTISFNGELHVTAAKHRGHSQKPMRNESGPKQSADLS